MLHEPIFKSFSRIVPAGPWPVGYPSAQPAQRLDQDVRLLWCAQRQPGRRRTKSAVMVKEPGAEADPRLIVR